MDQKNLAELYDLDPIPWSRALEALESTDPKSRTSFLATTRPDGRPHLAGIGAVWEDDRVYFVSGPGTRKSRNVDEHPAVSISFALTGLDLVVEGEARRVTDDATLQHVASRYAREGWPARVVDGAFTYDYSAPSAGPPPWYVYEVVPTTAFGVLSTEPGGATRWRFDT